MRYRTLGRQMIACGVVLLSTSMIADAEQLVVCESEDGARELCRVRNIRDREVRLERQLSDSPCREGRTWGVDDRGIWVDRGCRAEFSVFESRDRNYSRPDRYGDRYSDERRDWDRRGEDRRGGDRYGEDRHGYDRHSGGRYDRDDRYHEHRDEATPKREAFAVEQKVTPGTSWVGPKLRMKFVETVSVRVRRLDATATDTHISVGFDDNRQLGAQQVDAERSHWLRFPAGGAKPKGRRIVVTAHSGDVVVDEVVLE